MTQRMYIVSFLMKPSAWSFSRDIKFSNPMRPFSSVRGFINALCGEGLVFKASLSRRFQHLFLSSGWIKTKVISLSNGHLIKSSSSPFISWRKTDIWLPVAAPLPFKQIRNLILKQQISCGSLKIKPLVAFACSKFLP